MPGKVDELSAAALLEPVLREIGKALHERSNGPRSLSQEDQKKLDEAKAEQEKAEATLKDFVNAEKEDNLELILEDLISPKAPGPASNEALLKMILWRRKVQSSKDGVDPTEKIKEKLREKGKAGEIAKVHLKDKDGEEE